MREQFDLRLVIDFVEDNFAEFQEHLDEHDIEPTEAESIIDSLKAHRDSLGGKR